MYFHNLRVKRLWIDPNSEVCLAAVCVRFDIWDVCRQGPSLSLQ